MKTIQIYASGIHTDTGKSHFSALFCKLFGFEYFKLIQAGSPKDSDFVKQVNPMTNIYKEGFVLKTPASPHLGKKLEKADYKGLELKVPSSSKLLIELAGGLFTPLDEKYTMIDYISNYKKPTILVAKYYLGAINHILLSLNALKARQIPLLALVMMGKAELEIDAFIKDYEVGLNLLHLDFYKEGKARDDEAFISQMKALLAKL